ncbi:MAG: lysine--tRNA ligase [Acidobacteria bacterium]|nr:lysine--tRNA ligase [Acidobacteriota bacterium]
MNIPSFDEIIEPNDQTEARQEHLAKIAELVGNVYPNKFARTAISGGEDTITSIKHFEGVTAVEAEMAAIKANLADGERPPAEKKDAMNERLKAFGTVRIAGRLTTPPRGNFVHLTDGLNKLQIYCNKKGPLALIRNDAENTIDEANGWTLWQLVDHGDLIGVEGYLFVTNTGEVSVHVEKLQFLAKALLPMPDKMHGIADPELRRRYRYADLIASSLQVEQDGLTTREVFERRARLISGMRRYLDDNGYVEVETPMLTPKATGAAAKPFETHHNALDIPLYARIAPELYLKRLVVGGFEKVYELNRNFRNEGLSQKHNPEFTMLEFYCAYMDVNGMMDFAEKMIREAVAKANNGSLIVNYGENEIDFGNFARIRMSDAVSEPEAVATGSQNTDKENPVTTVPGSDSTDVEVLQYFEEHVEHTLIQPTFIIDYPKSISPLSKASPENPNIAERFELFINGMEVANGFSELNDPKEQYERFVDQMKERDGGDEEAMVLDEDYVRALAYGMPPAAGIGIGIDRLVMLLTNKHSIRDVILFPHMRPEKREGEGE